ncbi:MAG: ketoacyl-ACP synthase III [Acidimicrobiia bacterium]|nr:ketoacyl-ACP synthase III [Acidimicrobiia bacterium]MXZ87194.1 ketoacyl-ACP synthase III [Acidimicrobiia bacterium]MYB09510.1 ketoacyl-ACP synthase III [Acidimicrobiia bacterium]MYE71968.1 ketoacyl-ACP synthase III [Acidimicrobiia bacterium]MYG57976.1 ketoacyl-ACP synthase III [Acidimicrobiia bacterium]
MTRAAITGLGTATGHKVVTNHDLAAVLDTSDEWIVERTGIHERRVGGSCLELGGQAAKIALKQAEIDATDLDLIICSTCTPDQVFPAVSNRIQNELGASCGAFDLNAACSGFTYGISLGQAQIAAGMERVLVVGVDTLSRFTDWDDRSTAILFGDGAGAVVMEPAIREDRGVLSTFMGSEGRFADLLICDFGDYIKMDGKEVFRQAVRVMVSASQKVLADAGLETSDVAAVVPHQANARIIESAMKRLDIPLEKAATVLQSTGNTSSASIPLAMDDAVSRGAITDGDVVLLVGFGAGMSVAAALLRWGQ